MDLNLALMPVLLSGGGENGLFQCFNDHLPVDPFIFSHLINNKT
jgi:hypothetical protein